MIGCLLCLSVWRPPEQRAHRERDISGKAEDTRGAGLADEEDPLHRMADRLCPTSGETDVGPVTRQVSTRTGAGLGGLHDPTLTEELVRRQVAERAVWPALTTIDPPGFDLRLGLSDRRELMHFQTLVAKPSVECLDERVFNGLTGA